MAIINCHRGLLSCGGCRANHIEANDLLDLRTATAQVAKQEGYYLAERFNKAAETGNYAVLDDPNAEFVYTHRGSLAYIGKDAAVADIPGVTILKGIMAGLFWKSFETVSQVSVGNSFKVG